MCDLWLRTKPFNSRRSFSHIGKMTKRGMDKHKPSSPRDFFGELASFSCVWSRYDKLHMLHSEDRNLSEEVTAGAHPYQHRLMANQQASDKSWKLYLRTGTGGSQCTAGEVRTDTYGHRGVASHQVGRRHGWHNRMGSHVRRKHIEVAQTVPESGTEILLSYFCICPKKA